MLTVNKIFPAGRGLAPVLLKRAPSVTLDWDVRQKSRFEAVDSNGRTLGVFLPRGSTVRGGDVLVAEDGSLVRVAAAAQPVMVVRPCPQHGSAFDLTRAAYHLGNRHVQIELRPDHLKIEPDHVLGGMLERMHLIVTREEAPFEPEAGAYAGGHGHAHGRGEDHGHGHQHTHDHGHGDHRGHGHGQDVATATAVAHVHGPGCGHEHGHGHGDTHSHRQAHAHDHRTGHDADHASGHEHGHGHGHGDDHGQGRH